MTEATVAENATTALLGAVLVGGVYADGWAHLNVPGLDTFFTPWHGVLYGGFALLAGWLAVMVWRRRSRRGGSGSGPAGYGWGVVGVALFAVGGLLDMAWHLVFGVEAGIDALVSPTHLILLTGGMLMVTSPLRASAPRRPLGGAPVHRWVAVVAMATATALAGFFLSYLSVFVDPAVREPVTSLPEGAPGHRVAELPVVAGLAGYLVSTLLLVTPLLFLRRRARLPQGAVTALVAAVAIPAAALEQMTFAVPAAAALVGAALVDLIVAVRPHLATTVLAGLVPGLVFPAQLFGLAATDNLQWPVPLWSGVVGLSVLASLALALLSRPWTADSTTVTVTPGPGLAVSAGAAAVRAPAHNGEPSVTTRSGSRRTARPLA